MAWRCRNSYYDFVLGIPSSFKKIIGKITLALEFKGGAELELASLPVLAYLAGVRSKTISVEPPHMVEAAGQLLQEGWLVLLVGIPRMAWLF